MSIPRNRTTRGTPRANITEDDIQAQLRSDENGDNSAMGPKPQSPMVSSTESSHNDDPTDLSYPLPVQPMSSIQVADIDYELSLTRQESEELYTVMRASMHKHGVLGSLDFRNRVGSDDALKPVIKDVRGELPWLKTKAKKKRGPGTNRLGELLCGRARLVEVVERRKTKKGSMDVSEVQDQDMVENGANDEVAGRDDASVAAALSVLDVQDAPAAGPAPPPGPSISRLHTSTMSDFCPTSFIVRVEGSTNGAAVLATQLNTTAPAGTPISVDDLRLDRFLELVSHQVGFDVEGRISAVIPKYYAVAPIDSKIDVSSEAQWMAVLKAWQTMRRKTCEFVVEAKEVDA